MSYMFTNAVIVISVENVYKTAVLKTHKYSHSGAKPFLEGKLWVLWANVFYTNIPDESHVNSHRRKVLQTQKCDICGKYISKPLAWRCAKGKLLVLWKIVSQTNFPNESHVFSHRTKALQTEKCDMCGKYFSKTTVLKMHKFCHSGAKPVLRGKLRVCWYNPCVRG